MADVQDQIKYTSAYIACYLRTFLDNIPVAEKKGKRAVASVQMGLRHPLPKKGGGVGGGGGHIGQAVPGFRPSL